MRYLLDTNIVSYYLRRTTPLLEERVGEALKRHSIAISVITRAELRFGQAGMTPEDRRRGLIDSFLLRLPNIAWSTQAADDYGSLKDILKRQGTPIGDMDTLIAAHALAEDLILVTHNTRHFEKVPGLKLEDWMI
ncbi:type II toxin-antitoxin system VapC family toxin [Polaromonas sp.]|uniref:type II toxin-antitoxin system VapC family toxin n=1 Tax=Polaromonas sp. TaxID=1869339 RepID=UPI001A2679D9|nr:type II toxin-antitoxin system VapC family toxin [Burkholderiales bacterium]